MTSARDSNDSAPVQIITELCDDVITHWGKRVGTHYAGCWKVHTACLAHLIRNLIEEV